jgi:hypothetical protein
MMKRIILALMLLPGNKLFAQDSLSIFSSQRNQKLVSSMKVLGGWGIANTAVGAAGWATANGSTKYFHQMNTFWGLVNTGIAVMGFSGARRDLGKSWDATESLKAQKKLEKIFLINGGLDLVYIGTGLALKTRGNTRSKDKLKGYGSSILLQGIFLMIFDVANYSTQRTTGKALRRFLANHPISLSGDGIGVYCTF